ncbi:MAG: 50S ribosomal protein L9 [Candidatus Puniceispirillaceae bacterium]
MQIILLERVEKLGQMGDVVTVKPGYARNFLLPRGKALRANKANLEKFESEKAELVARNDKAKGEAMTLAASLDGVAVSIVRAASEMGQLFGSVNARDISAALVEAGHNVDRRQIVMDKAIKTLGLIDMRVNLHAEVSVNITLNIARSLEEAETQLASGKAVIASELLDEEDDAPQAEAVAEEAPAEEEAAEEAAAEEAAAEEEAAEEASEEA